MRLKASDVCAQVPVETSWHEYEKLAKKKKEARVGRLGEAVPLTWSPGRLQKGKLWRWEEEEEEEEGGADGPDGAGATQFHGVFSADVSVVTYARAQFGHWQGWWIDPESHCDKKNKNTLSALHAHFSDRGTEILLFSFFKKTKQKTVRLSFNVLPSESDAETGKHIWQNEEQNNAGTAAAPGETFHSPLSWELHHGPTE